MEIAKEVDCIHSGPSQNRGKKNRT